MNFIRHILVALVIVCLTHISGWSLSYGSAACYTPPSVTDSVNDTIIDSGYARALKEEVLNNTKLEEQIKYLSQVRDSLQKICGKDASKLNSMRTDLVNKYNKLEEDIRKKEESKEYQALIGLRNHKTLIMDSVSSLTLVIDTLKTESTKLDSTYKEIATKIEELEGIRESITDSIIASYKEYLERSLSKIELSELEKIKAQCQPYSDSDEIKAFICRIDSTNQLKTVYASAAEMAQKKYDESRINTAITALDKLIGANPTQQQEIKGVKEQLQKFGPGIKVMYDYICALNKNRGVGYSIEDLNSDQKKILKENDMENQINDTIMQVPYLKAAYEEYQSDLNKEPGSHPEIEEEINSYFNN